VAKLFCPHFNTRIRFVIKGAATCRCRQDRSPLFPNCHKLAPSFGSRYHRYPDDELQESQLTSEEVDNIFISNKDAVIACFKTMESFSAAFSGL
jgi:hypothetical protein